MPRSASIIFLILLFAFLFVLRLELLHRQETRYTLPSLWERTAVLEGTVAADPDRRETSLRAVVQVETANAREAHGKVVAILPRDMELAYGDRVVVRGLLEAPQTFETGTGRVFDYPGYLRAQGVSALMQHASLIEREAGEPGIRGALYRVKHAFEKSIERVFAEPRAALLQGLLLGEKRGLPDALTQAFIIAGLIHVVVLSGYNISVVSESVLRFFGAFLPRAAALSAGAVVIVLFALMSGGGAATVRACIMGLIAIVARYLRRPAAALRMLAVAAGGMVLWNPLVLLHDPGFILSVAATFGLVTLSPIFETKFSWLPNFKRFEFRSIAASTIAVQIFVLPALLYGTGVLSLVSLPANMLALPLVPSAMFLGFAAGVLGFLHPALALLPALCADLLLHGMILAATVFSSLPLAAVAVPAFPAWVAMLVYVPLTWTAVHIYRRTTAASAVRTAAP